MGRKNLEAIKEEAAETAIQINAAASAVKAEDALFMLGGINAMHNLASHINAQTMRAMQAIEETNAYRSLGHETFVDFLNDSRYSPMSKNQYYERRKVIESEGDTTYEVLNSLNVPIRARKLLTTGSVSVEGDEIIVGDQRARIDDRARVTEIIRALAEKSAQAARSLEKKDREIEKQKKRAEAAASQIVDNDSLYANAFAKAQLALVQLRAAVADLPADQRRVAYQNFREFIAPAYAALVTAYETGEDADPAILANDEELIAKLGD